ncbi:MAG: hypothetical protein HDR80_05220, partial [Bacteroides sp.]|nr:hypothetical protein [Bacteroides sp.]
MHLRGIAPATSHRYLSIIEKETGEDFTGIRTDLAALCNATAVQTSASSSRAQTSASGPSAQNSSSGSSARSCSRPGLCPAIPPVTPETAAATIAYARRLQEIQPSSPSFQPSRIYLYLLLDPEASLTDIAMMRLDAPPPDIPQLAQLRESLRAPRRRYAFDLGQGRNRIPAILRHISLEISVLPPPTPPPPQPPHAPPQLS